MAVVKRVEYPRFNVYTYLHVELSTYIPFNVAITYRVNLQIYHVPVRDKVLA